MSFQEEDYRKSVQERHFPLTISAATYDSTMCGWKYMASTFLFDSTKEQHAALRAHMERKMVREGGGGGGGDKDGGYMGYVADDSDGEELVVSIGQGQEVEGEDTAGEDDPESVLQFLRAVEEEQKRIIEEKRQRGEVVNDDKTEEFFAFLRAAEREQLRLIAQRTQRGFHDDDDEDSDKKQVDSESDNDDDDDEEEEEEDYEMLDAFGNDDDDDDGEDSEDSTDEDDNDSKKRSASGKGNFGSRSRWGSNLFHVDPNTKLLLPPEKSDTLYPLYSYTPHTGIINSLHSFGNFLVSGGNDETCVVYNMAVKKEQFVLNKLEGSITTVRFLNNGRHILMGTDRGTIDLHDFSVNMYCLWSAKAHRAQVVDIAVHKSNKLFLSCGLDSTLKMWDLVTGTLACSIRLRMSASAVKWSPSGSSFALALYDTVEIYDTDTLEKIANLTHERKVSCMAYLSDNLIATAGENKAITIFDISNGGGECLHRLEIHDARIKAIDVVRINIDEYILVSVCSSGGIAVWRVGYAFALLECFEKAGARFIDVRINAHPSLRKFVEARDYIFQKKAIAVQQEEEDDGDGEEEEASQPQPTENGEDAKLEKKKKKRTKSKEKEQDESETKDKRKRKRRKSKGGASPDKRNRG